MAQASIQSPTTSRGWGTLLCMAAALALTACGGGESTRRTQQPGPGAGGPADINACITDATAIAQSQLANSDLVDGGLLYDKWYAVLSPTTPPTNNIPVWEQRADTRNQSQGADTWRCKECHGWDYAGRDGAYNSASTKYTGFPGILGARTKQPAEIFCTIKLGTTAFPGHNFGAQANFEDVHIWNLTKFVLEGAVDTRIAANPNGIAANGAIVGGNVTNGKAVFQNQTCGSRGCHGPAGDEKVGSEGLGGLATENPWEVLHKVRFGDPGDNGTSTMPAFEFLAPTMTRQEMLDVITYMQDGDNGQIKGGEGVVQPIGGGASGGGASGGASGGGASGGGSGGGSSGGASGGGSGGASGGGSGGAPSNAVTTGKNLGGRLYDNHFAELNRTTAVTHPLWELRKPNQAGLRNARTGADTWRCKECHGWDYKGVNGVYGKAPGGAFSDTDAGTHYTEFPGIFPTRFTDAEAAFRYLKFGTRVSISNNNTLVHAFGVDATGRPFIEGSPALDDTQLRALAQFVVDGGAIDTDQYIVSGIGQAGAIGDPVRGQALYMNTAQTQAGRCVECHGADGKLIDFDSDPNLREYVGTLAQENPWETLHKIRFGNPGDNMPSALQNGLTDADSADILRYSQDLDAQ